MDERSIVRWQQSRDGAPGAVFDEPQVLGLGFVVKHLQIIETTVYVRHPAAPRAALVGRVLPKSPLGQAAHYVLPRWAGLVRYCEQPFLSIDNNLSERTLRCYAIGRKNWIFVGNDRGGHTAACCSALPPAARPTKSNRGPISAIPSYGLPPPRRIRPRNSTACCPTPGW
jgi:hypothetical protein